jgi:hypothetical protein
MDAGSAAISGVILIAVPFFSVFNYGTKKALPKKGFFSATY